MARSKRFIMAAAVVVALLVGSVTAYGQSPFKSSTTGTPPIKSIEAISFGPNGLLLIGDGRGAQVFAVETGDTTAKEWSKMEVPNIKDELAGRIGTTGKGIEIIKIAVNPASQTAYFAVRKLDGKKHLILTLNGDGKVGEFVLENVKYARVTIPTAEKSPTKITDITYAGDRLLVSAIAGKGEFASKFVAIPLPLENDAQSDFNSTKTYHVAHGKWETHAPIRTVMPYEENGKQYLVAAFFCTPIVKYAVEDLQPGATVEGTSVIELGYGNTPQDMFMYEKGGKKYILMNMFREFGQKNDPVGPSPYWTAKVDYTLLQETVNVNEKALQRTPRGTRASVSRTYRAQIVDDYHGVMHLDRLNAERALVVRTDDKGDLNLAVLPLP